MYSVRSCNLDEYIERLRRKELLSLPEVVSLCETAKEIFYKENNMVEVPTPVTVAGDIHGQFDDLLELFRVGGEIPQTNYLFLGDYIDRGKYSIEVISLLICYKVRYPQRVFILRGNHEARTPSQVYGFYDECMTKYRTEKAWNTFCDLFNYLPLTATIDKELFCMHGGLSPSFESVDELKQVDRIQEVPQQGVMADLLWSDPVPDIDGWKISTRGCGFFFGADVTKRFNLVNGFQQIVRAHQMMMEGFAWSHGSQMLTLFSAPNYCNRCGNRAAVMEIDEGMKYTFLQFEASPGDEPVVSDRAPDFFL